jgi:four helix bundle protein
MYAQRFEDLECWQEARKLTRIIYRLARKPKFARDYRLVDQITSAVVSCMNNIAEGFDSGLRTESVRFYNYARRSASEVQSCLYVALDQEYVEQSEFDEAYRQAERTRRVTTAWTQSIARGATKPKS